ncbi:hypothetical protein ES703_96106 [subsurface metagenome]
MSRVYSYSDAEFYVFPCLLCHRQEFLSHFECRRNRSFRIILFLKRGSEDGHKAVPDVFIQGSVKLEHNICHPGKKLIQECIDFPRLHVFGQAGETDYIREQNGGFFIPGFHEVFL